MEVRIKTEDKDGNVVFDGVLSPKEHEFVLNVGLNFLMANGALPFSKEEEDEDEDEPFFPPSTDELQ